ncbi:MAG: imidazolonepropionase [Bacteroidales bacterium]|nr:imidazolonepropionase [Bacteroidales bacterium]
MNNKPLLIGPFAQVVTMDGLNDKGHLDNSSLEIKENAGILVEDGAIQEIDNFEVLKHKASQDDYHVEELKNDMVLLPGFIDCHTHICYGGSRERDYALRVEGKTYLEIAASGGGILDTVQHTRQASLQQLLESLQTRANRHLNHGVTTCEVKSGYGLTVEDELKMLRSINMVNNSDLIDLVPTCLAAHVCPPEFSSREDYIHHVNKELLPEVAKQNLSKRVDIYIDKGAFQENEAAIYLDKAKLLGFDITIHADQFSVAGSKVAAEFNVLSADHLEESDEETIVRLSGKDVTGVVLPGASMGLGMHFAKVKKMLDHNMCVAISSDWNPGSAPMGDLLTQAAVLGAYEKLSIAETLAGITTRAAKALNLKDRGKLAKGMLADMVAFDCTDYRHIFYLQGSLKPSMVWKKGKVIR